MKKPNKKPKRRKERQQQAIERDAARAERTDEQQLAKLDAGGWKATKERKRLQARMDRKKKKKGAK